MKTDPFFSFWRVVPIDSQYLMLMSHRFLGPTFLQYRSIRNRLESKYATIYMAEGGEIPLEQTLTGNIQQFRLIVLEVDQHNFLCHIDDQRRRVNNWYPVHRLQRILQRISLTRSYCQIGSQTTYQVCPASIRPSETSDEPRPIRAGEVSIDP